MKIIAVNLYDGHAVIPIIDRQVLRMQLTQTAHAEGGHYMAVYVLLRVLAGPVVVAADRRSLSPQIKPSGNIHGAKYTGARFVAV